MVREPFVARGILHHEQIVLENRVGIEGAIARQLGSVQAKVGFVPLPVFIQQRNQRDWRSTNLRCQSRQIVERSFRTCVQHFVSAQSGQSLCFIGRQRRSLHAVIRLVIG